MKRTAERLNQNSPFSPQTLATEYRSHFEAALTQPTLVVAPNPSLVWWMPNYVPPQQGEQKFKNGFLRSRERKFLTEMRLWETKVGTLVASEDPAMEPRVVSVTTWKEGRLYDKGNFIHACKALLDSLQPDIIVNDSPAWCHDFYSLKLAKVDKMPVGTLVVVHRLISRSEEVEFFQYGETRSDSRQ